MVRPDISSATSRELHVYCVICKGNTVDYGGSLSHHLICANKNHAKKKANICYSSGKNAPFDKTDLLARGNFKQLKTEGDIFFCLFRLAYYYNRQLPYVELL